MFWDFLLLRFHFGFTAVPEGACWVEQAMTGAYAPLGRRLFALLPRAPARPVPVLGPLSRWALTQDCRPGTLLYRDANNSLQDWLASPAGVGWSPTLLAARLASLANADAAPHLARAQQPPPPGPAAEAAAFVAVYPDFCGRMVDLLSRVRLVDPDALGCEVLADFAHLWGRHWGSARDPADFSLDWFGLTARQALRDLPAPPPGLWNAPPGWVLPHEWAFLACCYRALRPADRLALFLLVYGGLDVRQVSRLLFSLCGPSEWRWPNSPSGWPGALDHLTDVWMDVVRCVAGARARAPRGA
jgi:hypothetical protein